MSDQVKESQALLTRLAELICEFDTSRINDQAISLSRTAIIDTLGVTLAGVTEPCVTNLFKVPGVGFPSLSIPRRVLNWLSTRATHKG